MHTSYMNRYRFGRPLISNYLWSGSGREKLPLNVKSNVPDLDDDEDSAKMLRHLELIDGEASEYGVRIVKLDDALMAKKYGHRDPVST